MDFMSSYLTSTDCQSADLNFFTNNDVVFAQQNFKLQSSSSNNAQNGNEISSNQFLPPSLLSFDPPTQANCPKVAVKQEQTDEHVNFITHLSHYSSSSSLKTDNVTCSRLNIGAVNDESMMLIPPWSPIKTEDDKKQIKLEPLYLPSSTCNDDDDTITSPTYDHRSVPPSPLAVDTNAIEYCPGVSSPGDSSSALNGGQKAFVPCKVCGDKASGYHYGVTSCEGCKGFFRRSIQKQIEYRCLRDGKCMVFRLNRNRCQYCRFKKCLAVGMSRDSVRYGRVPKRSRDRMQDDSRVSSMTGDTEADSELEKRQLALYDIILSVSQAHHSNCAYTDDKIKNLQQRPMHFPLDGCIPNDGDPMNATTELLEQHKVIMWETLAQFTTPGIQRVVEFAKRIPGFTELKQDDQLILIKAGFFEVWLVRVARTLNPQQFTVTFSDGSFVNREQLDLIYNPELVSSLFTFSVSFNNLHLNDGEIGLFTAVVLLSQDRPGLSDPKLVEQLQEKLIEALKLQLSRSHSSDPQVFPNLLMKLSELRSVGAKHNEVLGWYRMNWRRLKLPPLYAEIYDISKAEDTVTTAVPATATTSVTNGQHCDTQTNGVPLPVPVPPLTHVNGGYHGQPTEYPSPQSQTNLNGWTVKSE